MAWTLGTQGCMALLVGMAICLIVAYLSPASWSGSKDFAAKCFRQIWSGSSGDASGSTFKNLNEETKEAAQVEEIAEGFAPNTVTENPTRTTESWSNEQEARAAMEDLLQVPFPKARPRWLLNPTTNRCLELDLYSESLKLAVEVDGRQHAEWPNAFHATRQQFEQQQLRDALKDSLCKLQGVKLIRVPHTVKRSEIKSFLRQALAEAAIPMKPATKLKTNPALHTN